MVTVGCGGSSLAGSAGTGGTGGSPGGGGSQGSAGTQGAGGTQGSGGTQGGGGTQGSGGFGGGCLGGYGGHEAPDAGGLLDAPPPPADPCEGVPVGACGFSGSCTIYSAGGGGCLNLFGMTCAQANAYCATLKASHLFDPANTCPAANSCAGCPDSSGTVQRWDCSLPPPC